MQYKYVLFEDKTHVNVKKYSFIGSFSTPPNSQMGVGHMEDYYLWTLIIPW